LAIVYKGCGQLSLPTPTFIYQSVAELNTVGVDGVGVTSLVKTLAYILGFTYADGHVSNYSLSFEIHPKDVEILEFISKSIGENLVIKDTKGGLYRRLRINSKYMISILNNKYGLYSNKSKTLKIIHDIPKEFLGDFVRGILDGDGWVTLRNNSIETGFSSGSLVFLEQIKELIKVKGYIRTQTKTLKSGYISTCYSLVMYKSDSLKLKDLMYYSNHCFSLRRKRDKFFSNFYVPAERLWTKEEVKLLTKSYIPRGNLNRLCKLLNRTRKSVSCKIARLGLNEKARTLSGTKK